MNSQARFAQLLSRKVEKPWPGKGRTALCAQGIDSNYHHLFVKSWTKFSISLFHAVNLVLWDSETSSE